MSLGFLDPSNPCYDPTRSNFEKFFSNPLEEACIAAARANAGLSTSQSALVLGTPGQMTALTPGLPVGYDPVTGLITDNSTGATVVRTPTYAEQVAIDNPPPTPNAPWYCRYFGIGCGTGTNPPSTNTMLIGVAVAVGVIMLLGGGRR